MFEKWVAKFWEPVQVCSKLLRAAHCELQEIHFTLLGIKDTIDDILMAMRELKIDATKHSHSYTGGAKLPVFDEFALLQSVVKSRFDKDPHKKKMAEERTALEYIWEGLPPKFKATLGDREQVVRDTIRGLYQAMSSIQQETPDDAS